VRRGASHSYAWRYKLPAWIDLLLGGDQARYRFSGLSE